MKHRNAPKEKCPKCLSLWGPLGDTPPLRNRLFLGPYTAPNWTNTKVTSAKAHFYAHPRDVLGRAPQNRGRRGLPPLRRLPGAGRNSARAGLGASRLHPISERVQHIRYHTSSVILNIAPPSRPPGGGVPSVCCFSQ